VSRRRNIREKISRCTHPGCKFPAMSTCNEPTCRRKLCAGHTMTSAALETFCERDYHRHVVVPTTKPASLLITPRGAPLVKL
jgi:hypothetical protein